MSPEYSKKTNAELTEILKSRGLSGTGKKADLVAQLLKSDKDLAEATNTPTNNYAENADDVIDWEDDPLPEPEPASSKSDAAPAPKETSNEAAKPAQEATTKPVAPSAETSKPANGEAQDSAKPTATDVPTPKPAADVKPAPADTKSPTNVDDKATGAGAVGAESETTDKPAAAAAEPQPATKFSMGLDTTDLETELAKRRARAEKFGTLDEATAAQLAEQQKAIDRAKRFGDTSSLNADDVSAIKGLDQALPEKSRKRRGTHNDHEDGRKRRNGFRGKGRGHPGRGNRNQRGGRSENGGGSRTGGGGGGGGGDRAEQDRKAMEKRKARFG